MFPSKKRGDLGGSDDHSRRRDGEFGEHIGEFGEHVGEFGEHVGCTAS